jgi:hypothetical protein
MNKGLLIAAIAGVAIVFIYLFSKKTTATTPLLNTLGYGYPTGASKAASTVFNPSPVSAAPRIGVVSSIPSIISAGATLAATNPYASPISNRIAVSEQSGQLVNSLLASADSAFAAGPSTEAAPQLQLTPPPDVPIDLTNYGTDFTANGSDGVYYA